METEELRTRLQEIEKRLNIIGIKIFKEFPKEERKEEENIDKIYEDEKIEKEIERQENRKSKNSIKFKDEKEY